MACVRIGDTGQVVSRVIQALINNGFPELAYEDATTVFDLNVENAVRNFQARSGLPNDGIVGPQTAAALQIDISDATSSCSGSGVPSQPGVPGWGTTPPPSTPGGGHATNIDGLFLFGVGLLGLGLVLQDEWRSERARA